MEPMTSLIVVGILLILLGVLALFIPSIARLISLPGNEKIKAIATIIAGIIVIVAGYLFF
ncbi:MAG: hypothetical protein PVF58_16760 [Candidatus Methanofastidiosia archaeon]|jgi:hypothetical protein